MNHSFFYKIIGIAAVTGALGVMMGAFGAHSLKSKISPEYLDVLKTGVFYLFIHVLAMVATSMAGLKSQDTRLLRFTAIMFFLGIILFSGSLLLISTKQVTGLDISAIGFVTPIGGLCFIAGWICLAIWGFKIKGTGQA